MIVIKNEKMALTENLWLAVKVVSGYKELISLKIICSRAEECFAERPEKKEDEAKYTMKFSDLAWDKKFSSWMQHRNCSMEEKRLHGYCIPPLIEMEMLEF